MFPGNLQQLMEQAQQMQSQLANAKERIQAQEFATSAGGGVVKAKMRGTGEVLSLEIDPSVIRPDDREMLQDLVMAAINEGVRKSRETMQQELSALTGGLPLPGL